MEIDSLDDYSEDKDEDYFPEVKKPKERAERPSTAELDIEPADYEPHFDSQGQVLTQKSRFGGKGAQLITAEKLTRTYWEQEEIFDEGEEEEEPTFAEAIYRV